MEGKKRAYTHKNENDTLPCLEHLRDYIVDSIFHYFSYSLLLLLFLCSIHIFVAILTATLPFFVRRMSLAISMIGTHFLYVCLPRYLAPIGFPVPLSFCFSISHK